jgi:hypothetical protein
MELRKLSVRVEEGDPVVVLYARDVSAKPSVLHVKLGGVELVGRPMVLVEMLGRALCECYAAYVPDKQDGACDGTGVPLLGRQANALPPMVGPSEVDGTLSRSAVAPAKLLVLDGGTASSDHPASSGGGIRTSFYLIREAGDGEPCPSA